MKNCIWKKHGYKKWHGKNDADIKKLYELRGELSILHQFKRIKNKNNEENGN